MTLPQAFRGQRLGLPESGPGSLAPVGLRIAAFLVDAGASGLVAALFVGGVPRSWSLVPFALDYVLGMLLAGRTLGMYLFGLRIVRVDRTAPVDPVRAVLRTALLALLVPAVIWDRDTRGLHDRVADTAVVRA